MQVVLHMTTIASTTMMTIIPTSDCIVEVVHGSSASAFTPVIEKAKICISTHNAPCQRVSRTTFLQLQLFVTSQEAAATRACAKKEILHQFIMLLVD
jgi:hypothetical protein